ncbi:MAG: hypothetical protein IIA87_00370 [Nanoarchaeota archaeon]|nr:hypothetical protein [Nanoarchaeota archaeon]
MVRNIPNIDEAAACIIAMKMRERAIPDRDYPEEYGYAAAILTGAMESNHDDPLTEAKRILPERAKVYCSLLKRPFNPKLCNRMSRYIEDFARHLFLELGRTDLLQRYKLIDPDS